MPAYAAADGWLARYAHALRYPLQVSPLLTLALLAVGRIVASSVPLAGRLLHVLVWGALYSFAYEVLVASADGRRDAPEAPGVVERALASAQSKVQAVLMAGVIFATGVIGPTAGTITALIAGALMPALLIALTVERNFVVALSPGRWLDVLRALGPDYLALLPLSVAALLFQDDVAAMIPAGAWRLPAIVAFYTAAHWCTIAAFHLIGRALFEHRVAFGFEAEAAEPLRDPAELRAETALSEIDGRIARGDAEGALAELRLMVNAGASRPLNLRYRELLVERGERAALVAHARVFVGQLMNTGAERQALALAAESLESDPAFLPTDAADVARLFRAAERLGLYATAAALAANYARANAKRRDGAAMALDAARLMAERLDRKADARALLTQVHAQARHSDDATAIEAAIALL